MIYRRLKPALHQYNPSAMKAVVEQYGAIRPRCVEGQARLGLPKISGSGDNRNERKAGGRLEYARAPRRLSLKWGESHSGPGFGMTRMRFSNAGKETRAEAIEENKDCGSLDGRISILPGLKSFRRGWSGGSAGENRPPATGRTVFMTASSADALERQPAVGEETDCREHETQEVQYDERPADGFSR